MKLPNNSNTIVLSDSFKATISSQEIGQLWQARCGFDYLPVSDGGEGALDALSAILKGEYITINGIDLYIDNQTAYIETAKVVGYDPSKDVYTRNTLDLGTTIYKLTTMDITKIVIFIGGTSTNDGGFGILSALGYKFLDKNNNRINPLPANFAKIVSVEKSPLPEVEIIGCTDVFNSLCGEAGATFTYGTQKGVTNHQLLDDEISRIASLIDVESIKTCGSGAGGGIGYAITQFEDYTIIDGYSYISNLVDYQQLIAKYQTVITGEGRLDGQTINGKLPFRILNDAKQSQTKVEGVFAVTEDSSLVDQFNAIYNVAVDNKINDYNLEHAVENYQNFITRYKFNHGIYKGILFDLDGVLCDTAELHYLAWKRLANELGGDIDKEFNETLKGVDRSESLRRILAKIDITLTEEQFNEAMELKNTWYVESLDTLSSADILPGVEQFLQQILDHGFKIAIASASKNAPHILDKIGLTKFVDTIANPEDVKVNKPAPDIFLLAAEQLGLNNYECIGIEDSQAGIDALNSGIIDSIAIGDVLENATIKLSSTSQLSLDLLK